MTTPRFVLLAILAAAFAPGCDSQTGPNFRGEPLASVKGAIQNQLGRDPGELDVLLIWTNTASSPDSFATDRVSVSGDFPTAFRLEVYDAPPDDALNDFSRGGERPNETRMGIAMVMALPYDFELTDDAGEPAAMGLSERHMLVYAESDTVPGSWTDDFFGHLDAGFHLMRIIDRDDPACGDEFSDCLVEAEDGFETEIEIRIADPADLDFSSWTK